MHASLGSIGHGRLSKYCSYSVHAMKYRSIRTVRLDDIIKRKFGAVYVCMIMASSTIHTSVFQYLKSCADQHKFVPGSLSKLCCLVQYWKLIPNNIYTVQ